MIDGILAVDSIKTKRTVASVTVGQQSQCVVEIRVIGAVEARLVGASDDGGSRNRRRRNLLYNCKSNDRSNYRPSRCSDKDPVRIR